MFFKKGGIKMAYLLENKVIFVHTPCIELNDDRLEPPLGILYLATILKKEGIRCQICDLSGISEADWRKNTSKGDIYAFSTYSVNYHKTLKIRNIAKEINPEAITIAGGPHVSALPDECSNDFDIIITGEAESCFLETIKAIFRGERPKGIFQGEPVKDLDSLPFPDYDLIDLESYNRIVGGQRSMSLITSRGCPYNCKFCNSLIFSRGQLRFRSPENVVEEIVRLKNKYGITAFRFSDDLFTFSPERIIKMAEALKPLGIVYRVFARSSSITEEAANALYDSGCRHIAIGIESMSDKILKLLEKKATKEINIRALRNARKAGLKTRIYILVGFPGETEETVNESLEVLKNSEFDEFVIYPFIPYPGTAVWMDPEFWGASIDRDFSKYIQIGSNEYGNRGTCYAVTTKDFSPDDVRRWRETMMDVLEKRKYCWAGMSRDNR